MASSLIGLGANLAPRRQTLDRAVERLANHPRVSLVAKSRWYETSPVGGPDEQPMFVNGAALIETSLEPEALLALLITIEDELGRVRAERWGPRKVDLDLLLFDERVIETPALTVPHPRMAWRRFVLEPGAEIAASMRHPAIGWTMGRLLEHLDRTPRYVAIAGGIGAGKSSLAALLAPKISGEVIAERVDLDRLAAFYANPTGHAWDTELEFLQQRTHLLAADRPLWSEETLVVSDFWFHQSLAFSHVWLSRDQRERFRRRWEASQERVVRPRLIVLLDVAPERLRQRVLERGRDCEKHLTLEQLGQIHQAVVQATAKQGPLLRLTDEPLDRMVEEAAAAATAM